MAILGIDTASVAGNKRTDWLAAKTRGPISFAILRAAWGTTADTYFRSEWAKMIDAGLTVGAYLFLRFPMRKSPRVPSVAAQIDVWVRALGAVDYAEAPSVLPPAIDVEFPGEGAKETGMSPAELLAGVRTAWEAMVKTFGCAPIIYTSGRVWRDDLKNIAAPDLLDSPLWLARYPYKAGPAVRDPARVNDLPHPPIPKPWDDGTGPAVTNYWIHQYQGDAKDHPGFSAGVDMNRWNVLAPGAVGARVAWVQRRLGINVTSRFDAASVDALKRWQAKNGLVADGYVGPRSFARLAW